MLIHEPMAEGPTQVPTVERLFKTRWPLGTGVGLRYDLGFLVIRIDWGLALHAPYDTGRSGYFNMGPLPGRPHPALRHRLPVLN